jgi:hypothetical protein
LITPSVSDESIIQPVYDESLENLYKELKIFNSPVHGLSWTEENNWGQRLNLLESEFEKIDSYRELGHLADYKSAKEYLQWTLYH